MLTAEPIHLPVNAVFTGKGGGGDPSIPAALETLSLFIYIPSELHLLQLQILFNIRHLKIRVCFYVHLVLESH